MSVSCFEVMPCSEGSVRPSATEMLSSQNRCPGTERRRWSRGRTSFRRPGPSRVPGVTHDPQQSVLGQWAGCPTFRPVGAEPLRCRPMVDVIGVAERDEEIHVQQVHSASSSSSLATMSAVTRAPRAGRCGKPSSSTSKSAGVEAPSCTSRSRACVMMALRVVPRRTAMAFAARRRASGSSMVVFIWVRIWFYGSRSSRPSHADSGLQQQFPQVKCASEERGASRPRSMRSSCFWRSLSRPSHSGGKPSWGSTWKTSMRLR